MAKLTRAQRELLIEVFNGEDACTEAYRPAQKLVENGFCIWRRPNRLGVTNAGRAALEASHDQ